MSDREIKTDLMNKSYKVYNQGKYVGNTRPNKNNIKKLKKRKIRTIIGLVGIGITIAFASKSLKPKSTNPTTQTTESNVVKSKPTYDIQYTIKSGDTIWDVAAKYTEFSEIPEEVYAIQLKNPKLDGSLQIGTTIELPHVPGDKLSQFGYEVTSNLQDKAYFITVTTESVANETAKQKCEDFANAYDMYSDNPLYSNERTTEYLNYLADAAIKSIEDTTGVYYSGIAQKINEDTQEPEELYEVQYKVKDGDTLSGIVKSYTDDDYNNVYDDVIATNNINPNKIKSGQEITLTGVEESDLGTLGYSNNVTDFYPQDELESLNSYINENDDYVNALSTDEKGMEDSSDIKSLLKDYHERYQDFESTGAFDQETLNMAREIKDLIEQFTGREYQFAPKPLTESFASTHTR
ncbi:MAG TPA: LysM peptidoglycan-binding domain-containing protein [Bacilli bacterium]|nr:LysM peptidoglycan-binding domain-containing protein [Bacilli bacterium]